jgi:hypothetical protein
MQKQRWQQRRCCLVQPEYRPIEGVQFASKAVDKQDERSQTDKIEMNGQRRSESANENKDSRQQIEEPDDFKEETLPFDSKWSSANFQRFVKYVVGTADCVNGFRLSDIIKNPSNIAIGLNFVVIDFQEDVAGLNSGKLCRSVTYYLLSLYRALIGLDPGTAIIRGIPFPILRDIEPTQDQQSNADQRYENKSEGNDFPIIRNGY